MTVHRDGSVLTAITLEHPLVDDYLAFVAARARMNTWLAVASDLKIFFGVVGKPPVGIATAVQREPTDKGGSTAPRFTASTGSWQIMLSSALIMGIISESGGFTGSGFGGSTGSGSGAGPDGGGDAGGTSQPVPAGAPAGGRGSMNGAAPPRYREDLSGLSPRPPTI
ncbi:MAG: hypothetical protein M3Y35_12820 [Actinomycetota bacterium]|nr:hypothetical protein [Actinomycetota bacterium]